MKDDAEFRAFVDAHGGECVVLDDKVTYLTANGSTVRFSESGHTFTKVAGAPASELNDAERVVEFWQVKLRRCEGDLGRIEELSCGLGGEKSRGRYSWHSEFYNGLPRPIAPRAALAAIPAVESCIANCRERLAAAEAEVLALAPWRRKSEEPAPIWWG